jgi:outer membrane protein assembly factor BamE (lipoprotein component of BamABCDE complex)
MPHRGPATDRIAVAARASRAAAAAAVCAVALAGCQTLSTYMPAIEQIGVYKLDINQGNYLAQDQVDRLKVGQTPQQVRQILGTPLVQSPFRPDRWDYVYEYKKQGRALEHRNFAVYFVDGRLARWEGDEMPMSVAVLNREAAAKTLKPDPSAEDRGIFAWFWDLFK